MAGHCPHLTLHTSVPPLLYFQRLPPIERRFPADCGIGFAASCIGPGATGRTALAGLYTPPPRAELPGALGMPETGRVAPTTPVVRLEVGSAVREREAALLVVSASLHVARRYIVT